MKKHSESGLALVEASFIIPIIVLLLFGIVQIGLVIAADILLNNASVIGARTASIEMAETGTVTLSEIEETVKDTLRPFLGQKVDDVSTTLVPEDLNGDATDDAYRVNLQYNFPTFLSVVPGLNGASFELNASCLMR